MIKVVLALYLCPYQTNHKCMEDVISTDEHEQQSDEGDEDQEILSDSGEKYNFHLSITCCCLHQLFSCSYYF